MKPWSVQLVGDLAYVQYCDSGAECSIWLSAFDLSNPAQPQQVNTLSNWTKGTDVFAVNSKYLYVSTFRWIDEEWDSERKLKIIDVSDLAHPILINTLDMVDFINQLRVQGNRLYGVLDFNNPQPGQPESAIVVWDVSDPLHVTELARHYFDNPGAFVDMDVEGDCIYATVYAEIELAVFCTAVTGAPTSTPTLTATPDPSATPTITSTSTATPTPEATASSTATLPVAPTSTATATRQLPTYLPLILAT